MELKWISTAEEAWPVSREIALQVALYVAIAVFGLIPGHGAIAAEEAPTSPANAPKTAASGDDFTGDKLVLKSNVHGFVLLRDGSAGWIALQGTILRVTQDATVGGGNGDLLVAVATVPCVIEVKSGKTIARRDRIHLGVGGFIDCPTEPSEIGKLVKTGEVYRISKDRLEQYGYFRSGWVYGALLVPYKYHFHDKSFVSATTIGPYLGYRMGGLGVETSFVVSVGLSSLAVANPNGSGDTATIQGFSFAIGLIGGVNKGDDPLRFGVLLGRDWAGSNSTVRYEHEGKTWAAVQIGFSFSR